MTIVIPLEDIGSEDRPRVGGKAWALSRMACEGIRVPSGFVIPTDAYDSYVDAAGLRERILLELNRKDFADMRWEELWDAALRIRNMFVRTSMAAELSRHVGGAVERFLGEAGAVVRSSAPMEDSARASFAGLHDSFVNVRGAQAVLDKIRLVWASLWSDRALLYRQELGLDIEDSAMAVVVQRAAIGECSGVVFGQDPRSADRAVIEAVHGLNEGLVDGTVEADHWELDRQTGAVTAHRAAERERAVRATAQGAGLVELPEEDRQRAPLDEEQLERVWLLSGRCEETFGSPQDVEWTFVGCDLLALQSRPITGSGDDADSQRRWYLSLTRSFGNLRQLRRLIEDELLPAMDAEAEALAHTDPALLSDDALAREIERRRTAFQKWRDAYWEHFIPFAHGARLFGQVYNDVVRPGDPFEFTALLAGTGMLSMARNRAVERLAAKVRSDRGLRAALEEGVEAADPGFRRELRSVCEAFGGLPGALGGDERELVPILLAMASGPVPSPSSQADAVGLEEAFLSRFEGAELRQMRELLDLARASYRLRDDDNIHLGRVEAQLEAAAAEGRSRLHERFGPAAAGLGPKAVARALADPHFRPDGAGTADEPAVEPPVRARQLVGQPASPGVAIGVARSLRTAADMRAVRPGEVFVCDAIDPNMTFVVPLAAGIVERRGGMLIHGAIIAREYGIPCVTGVPRATELIRSGDRVTVDGHLGIVTITEHGR